VSRCCRQSYSPRCRSSLGRRRVGSPRRRFETRASANLPDGPYLYANAVKLSPSGQGLEGVRDQIETWLDRLVSAGLRPKAVVIDSLARQYGFGASLDRNQLADLVHLAAIRGLLLVLVQEVAGSDDDWVSFIPDVVIGVRRSEDRASNRLVRVEKNRFGPAADGDHLLELVQNGEPLVYPNIRAYSHGVADLRVFNSPGEPIGIPKLDRLYAKSFQGGGLVRRGSSLLLWGSEPVYLQSVALNFLNGATGTTPLVGNVTIGARSLLVLRTAPGFESLEVAVIGNLNSSPEGMLSRLLGAIATREQKTGQKLSRLCVGDLSVLAHLPQGDELGRALIQLPRILGQRTSQPAVALVDSGGSDWVHLVDASVKLERQPTAEGTPPSALVIYRSELDTRDGSISCPLSEIGVSVAPT
jgi:hypothetical protein